MNRLTDDDVQKALEKIKPQKIEYKNAQSEKIFEELNKFSDNDYGRGLINSEMYGLTETITTGEKIQYSSDVVTNTLDSILLSTSLKAYKESKKLNNSGDILFSMPPYSFTFPLLLSYHLIMNHISRSLTNGVGAQRFNMGEGILIISHNIELLSHIWRTSISNIFLRDFVPTYIIENGEYKNFTFKEKRRVNKRKQNVSVDGTLPWLCFYRAYRKTMPDFLELKPEVIIIDLLPFFHRKRGQELINWAKKHAKHVIVIAPSNYSEINELRKSMKYFIPIDYSTFQYLDFHIDNAKKYKDKSLTASWGTDASLTYLSKKSNSPYIVKYKKINKKINEYLLMYYKLLKKCFTPKGILPTSIFKVNSIFLQMLNVCVPLEWYERTRWANNQPTLLELMKKFSKIQSTEDEEIRITNTLLPHLMEICLSFYNLLLNQKYSIRGYLLIQTLESLKNKKVTIIVTDKTDASEIKVWLKSISVDISNLKIVSQKDWAESQLKEIISTEIEIDALILTNPWQKKLLTSFYIPKDIKQYLIDPLKEESIYKYQYDVVFNNKENLADLKSSLSSIFKNKEKGNQEIKESINYSDVLPWKQFENVFYDFFQVKNEEDNILEETIELGSLFEDDRLIELISSTREDDEEDLNSNEISLDINSSNEGIKKEIIFIDCHLLEVLNKSNSSLRVFMPNDSFIKIKKFNKNDLEIVNILEIKPKDVWIKIREDHRKELFNEILKLSSNTLLMQWIKINVDQWKEMLSELWQKYSNKSKFKKGVYEVIQKEINLNGGKVESYLTIANWFNGDTLIRGKENMLAIVKILDNDEYMKRINTIRKAIEELWGLNIKLGKALVKIIERESLKQSSSIENEVSWVNLGNDIVISLEEILNVVQFLEIENINKYQVYKVPFELTGKLLSENTFQNYIDRGIINIDV